MILDKIFHIAISLKTRRLNIKVFIKLLNHVENLKNDGKIFEGWNFNWLSVVIIIRLYQMK